MPIRRRPANRSKVFSVSAQTRRHDRPDGAPGDPTRCIRCASLAIPDDKVKISVTSRWGRVGL